MDAEYVDRLIVIAENAIKDKELVNVQVVKNLLTLIDQLRSVKSLHY